MPSPLRPLSPHLQIYRWQLTSVLSILHRITGVALAVGTLLLVYWLIAIGCRTGDVRDGASVHRLDRRTVAAVRLDGGALLSPGQRHPASAVGCGEGLRTAHRLCLRLGRRDRRRRALAARLDRRLCVAGRRDVSEAGRTFRTELGRVRGLGAAKEGVHHWWMQRVSAIALVPLTLWFVDRGGRPHRRRLRGDARLARFARHLRIDGAAGRRRRSITRSSACRSSSRTIFIARAGRSRSSC